MTKRKIPEVDAFLKDYEFLKDRVARMCYVQGCKKQSRGLFSGIKGSLGYGLKGGDRVSCKQHKLPEHVEQNQQCIYLGCKLRGKQFLGNHKFCVEHKDEVREAGGFPEDFTTGQKQVMCKHAGCEVQASYDNWTRCKTHATSAKSDDKRKCDFPGCVSTQRPTYGIPGQPRTRCKEHRTPDMTSHKRCAEKDCKVSASYGLPDEVAKYCNKHKKEGFILNTKKCAQDGCERQPSFGATAESEPTHCSRHKPEEFVDARNKRCCHQGCLKNRSFGTKDGERLWCYDHKEEDCVNLVETMCAMECCMYGGGIQAAFFHPQHEDAESEFFEKRICSFARRYLIEVALMDNKEEEVKILLRHFGLQKVVTLNAQTAVRVECEKEYHHLLKDCDRVVFDESVNRGPKIAGNKRPDIFYKWIVNDQGFAIHIEYDETSSHEDEVSRLERIARESGCEGKTYVIRVRGGHGTTNPVCEDVNKKYFKYSAVTQWGKGVCEEVSKLVKERIGWIHEGLAPEDSTRLGKVFV